MNEILNLDQNIWDKIILYVLLQPLIRDVAQSGSVLVWGARGRKFKSCHPDLMKIKELQKFNCNSFLFRLPYSCRI